MVISPHVELFVGCEKIQKGYCFEHALSLQMTLKVVFYFLSTKIWMILVLGNAWKPT